jgi:hypothetical protein
LYLISLLNIYLTCINKQIFVEFMKANLIVNLLLLFIYTSACANKNDNPADTNTTQDSVITTTVAPPDSFETGKVIPKVICKNDASQSYALYIPAKENNEALPIIYFFDPHAAGSFPLNKYKTLADTYNFILVGSNNSKNGNDWNTTEKIWNTISTDTKNRLKINSNRIYTCGFSGGGKVASYIALQHSEIESVIVGGAALPDGAAPGNFNFSYTILSGEGDMNMTDLLETNNELNKTQTIHRIIFFNGTHEWAPEKSMNIAFAGLQLDAMRKQLITKDNDFISNYVESNKKSFNEFFKSAKLINAARVCEYAISMLDGLTDEANWFKEKKVSLEKNSAYQTQLKNQQQLLNKEQTIKASYQQQFQQGDLNYWTKEINDLKARSKITNAEGAVYQRLLAYLSLAFYSISNQLINGNNNEQAAYFDNLYKTVDPTNSEAWYFSAILNARNNNAKSTEDDLLKAVANGFNDTQRMMQQPEFQALSSQLNFSKITSGIKN